MSEVHKSHNKDDFGRKNQNVENFSHYLFSVASIFHFGRPLFSSGSLCALSITPSNIYIKTKKF